MSDGRVAVIGDIGGHRDELRTALIDLGADPDTLTLPPDLAVVQVGDLVHRGPDSAGVVSIVDAVMTRQPTQWTQLVGNHEAQYLTRQPRFEWNEKLGQSTVRTVQRWWREGRMVLAAAITAPDGDWLATHAGLTRGFWQRLGTPATATAAATALNRLAGSGDLKTAFHGGVMIDGVVDLNAGPIWAAAGAELAMSWLDGPSAAPFHQIHGHSAIVNWNRREWQAPERVVQLSQFNHESRHCLVHIGDRVQLGIDPAFGTRAGVSWKPFVMDGARLA